MIDRAVPPTRVALLGVGSIAASYIEGLRSAPGFEVVAVCSRQVETAREFASAYGLKATSIAEMLADPTIDYVMNLTPAGAHGEITRACLQAGKSVYSEKPLAATLAEADSLIALAEDCGLLLACAPANILWPPLVTARRIIAEGTLGPVIGALATLVYPGPELFHANPAQFYLPEAGPLKDMGVYQVAALCALLGPVVEVSAMTSCARPKRAVRVGLNKGNIFPVLTPTHVNALLRHSSGVISTMIVSFDGIGTGAPRIEIFGTAAGLCIDNAHGSKATVTLQHANERHAVALDGPLWTAVSLAIGPISAWIAHQTQKPIDCSAATARNVLSTLLAIEQAAERRVLVTPD